MTKCKSCGEEHELALKDEGKGIIIPMDWCWDCILSQGSDLIKIQSRPRIYIDDILEDPNFSESANP